MAEQSVEIRSSYDEVPYPSLPLPQTHPEYLATIAKLLNLQPPFVKQCRVLELGCASGGNLIPMAVQYPNAQFVGVDNSSVQIDMGIQTIRELDAKNIHLHSKNILELDADQLGQFDYILCHGVYSWVPEEVQHKILTIYRKCLQSHGIGYISYNTHPGWHFRGLVRKMMRFHVSRYQDEKPEVQIAEARRIVKFLSRAASDEVYSGLLNEQMTLLDSVSDEYIYHEYLEENNQPIWFLEFDNRLRAAQLRYLADTDFGSMVAFSSFDQELESELDELASDLHNKEQYLDLMRNRSFRQSLVCHQELSPDYAISATRVFDLYVSSQVEIESDENEQILFRGSSGMTVESTNELVSKSLSLLTDSWPEAIAFNDLLRSVLNQGIEFESVDAAATDLAKGLLTIFTKSNGKLVQFSSRPRPVQAKSSKKPIAFPLARLQAKSSNYLTSALHETAFVTPFDRHLLPLMDGSRDDSELSDCLLELFKAGDLEITKDDDSKLPVSSLEEAGAVLKEVLKKQLPALARSGLIVG